MGKRKWRKNAWKQLRVIKDTVFYWNLLQTAEEPLLSKNGVSYDLSNNCSSQPHSNFSSTLTAWMSTSNGWSPISETRKYFFFRIKFQIKSMLLRRSSCLVSHRKKRSKKDRLKKAGIVDAQIKVKCEGEKIVHSVICLSLFFILRNLTL